MSFLYNIAIHIASFLLPIVAIFNKKIKLFVNGRKETFSKLSSISPSDKVFWFHAASLGEFEQGRPIIERLKKLFPNHKIVVTFFSPSGYEIRKNYNLADVVCYLPLDTPSNVKKFIQKVHPDMAVIIKYEFWPNLLKELKRTQTKTILVSGIFRKEQLFFKSSGSWMRKSLQSFDYFFVQNEESKKLLHSISLSNVTVSGDTRFDRVYEILQQDNSLDFIEEFKNDTYTIVAGSTWKEDEELIVNYINNSSSENEKFIIAPHNINPKQIQQLQQSIHKKTVLFSDKEDKSLKEYQVFIIDTIGILTKIYSYANVAYVGGGLATGLHNILEPATFGIPVVFGGNKHQKFNEAIDLISLNGAKTVTNKEEFSSIFVSLKNQPDMRHTMGKINKQYVEQQIGATNSIVDYINNNL
ncbi:3-deoxy-D-manno-octulosonic acid transferase [Tenacibaculum sp. IB213877]|uniref:3-deoxy-D-manno-octulosonic acid transferase n=1 Tax=Tenacibaculum sp. IB213877 TaxID=3097351 RepID=UPI002A5A3121|nr:glycosyltransferase N-terminal domain-containing protein [Tenacibaculum sp. IB213877]MDY0781004.1 glycosyltransferase N-terminal domain-containing protein [Tenacibaculum sp. IB213877]